MIAAAPVRDLDHRQTIELPSGFELAAEEVWVRKDETTGEITLTPRLSAATPAGLDRLFALLDAAPLPLPEDFLSDQQNPRESPRDPLADGKP